ncbi:hypothetical protein QL093DRAFT_2360609 [Fusarium oxysporum]|nr:hypothetical protein QL093DRAFT_2360609 [Fusarium oxysporum]
MRPLSVPIVSLADRYIITRVTEINSCHAVTLRHGYKDNVLYPGLAHDVVQQIELAIARGRCDDVTTAELDILRSSHNSGTVYVFGKGTMKIDRSNMRVSSPQTYPRTWLLWIFLWI